MTFTPDYTAYYLLLDGLTTSITPNEAHGRNDYLGLDQSRGFLDLPFLALLMMLDSPLLPNPVATQMGLGLTPTENYCNWRSTRRAARTIRPGLPWWGLLEFKPDLFYTVMGKNRMEYLRQDGTFFPMRIQAKGCDHSTSGRRLSKSTLRFPQSRLICGKETMAASPCCARIGTLYYSILRVVLDPSKSTLVLNGQNIKLNGGNFCLDHQWGTSGNPKVDVIRAALNTHSPRG